MALSVRRSALFAATALVAAGFQPMFGAPALAAGLATPSSLAPDSTGSSPSTKSAVEKDPVLSWAPVAGAARYRVELSRSDDWTDDSVKVTLPDGGVVRSTSFAVTQTLTHGAYFWHVRAEQGTTAGAWSADAQLYKGWLDAPAIAATDPALPFRLAWTALPDASTYEVETSIEPTFPQPGSVQSGKTIDSTTTVVCLTAQTSWTPYHSNDGGDAGVDDCDLSNLDTSGGFYMRVRGIDDSSAQVPAHSGPAPVDCFGVPNDPALDKVDTTTALGSPTTTSQECSLWSTTTARSGDVFQDGAAFDAGNLGTPVVQLSCDPDCDTATDEPEISWAPVEDTTNPGDFAKSYQVTIATDPAFTSVVHSYQTSFNSVTPRDQLPDYTAGQGYWVAVAGCTDTGCGNAGTAHFVKRTPKVNNLAAVSVPNGVRLSWTALLSRFGGATATTGAAAVEPVDYLVQVARSGDAGFVNLVLNRQADTACDTAVFNDCYQPGVNEGPGTAQAVIRVADGDYLWRIVPVDVSGNHLPASATQSVSIDTTAPVLRLTDSSGIRVTANLHIRASEGAVQGVNGSNVHVREIAGGDNVAGTLTKTGDRTWTFNPSGLLVTGERYELTVSAAVQDSAGNNATVGGTPVRTTTQADDDDASWSYAGAWSGHSSSGAIGGTFRTGSDGKSATVRVVGSKLKVYGCKGPHFGKVRVIVDGNAKTKVNEHQSFSECKVLLWQGPMSASNQHTVKLAVVSGTGALDAVRVA